MRNVIELFTKMYAKILLLGYKNVCICIVKKMYYQIIRSIYRFDPWHASAPYECRNYKRIVVELANELCPNVVLEIGCGLAEIVSHISAKNRYGIDCDDSVISAARLLSGKKVIVWKEEHYDISRIPDDVIDVCIIVNVFAIESDQWKQVLSLLMSKKIIRFFITDMNLCCAQAMPCMTIVKELPDNEGRMIRVFKTV